MPFLSFKEFIDPLSMWPVLFWFHASSPGPGNPNPECTWMKLKRETNNLKLMRRHLSKKKEERIRNACKISFGDIPNSSSIDILMPYAIFDYIGAFLRNGFAHVDNVIPVIKKQSHGCLQGNKPHRNSPEPSEPCLRNLHQHALELFGTLRNRPNPAFGTYTNTRRNSPEPSGTFQDLPESTILHRNSPEPSATCLQNLHHFSPELSGTFRNPPPEPTPAHTGTLRNLPEPASGTHTSTRRNSPEPSSGTCSCDPHRHTPELIWAKDPISLRSWGIKHRNELEWEWHKRRCKK